MPIKKNDKGKVAPRPGHRQVMMKASSKAQVKRYLKYPLSKRSAVIYFTEKDRKPFILSPEGGGLSSDGEHKLTKKWKLTKDKLDRIFIIASVEDTTREADKDTEDNK